MVNVNAGAPWHKQSYDRFLNDLLPGLLGGCALAAPELWSRIAGSFPAARVSAANAATSPRP